VSRRVRLLFVYVGGDTDFNHRDQFFETVGEPSLDGVEIEYYGDADHTVYRVSDRARTVARIGDWASRQFRGSTMAMDSAAAAPAARKPVLSRVKT